MLKKTVFIIFFILVSAGFTFLGSTHVGAEPDDPLVVTSSIVGDKVMRLGMNVFGKAVRVEFWDGTKWVKGRPVKTWLCDGPIGVDDSIVERVNDGTCRQRRNSTGFYAEGSWFPCLDNFPCNLWP